MEWGNWENRKIKWLQQPAKLNSNRASKSYTLAVKPAFSGPLGQISHLQTLSSCLEDILTSSVILCHQLLPGKTRNTAWYFGNKQAHVSQHTEKCSISQTTTVKGKCKPSMISLRLLFSRAATETWPEIICSAGEALQLEGTENGFPLTNMWGKEILKGTCKGQRTSLELSLKTISQLYHN